MGQKYVLGLAFDGQYPGGGFMNEEDIPAGSIVLDNAPEDDDVWDATTSSVRKKRPAEDLEEARKDKKADLAREGRNTLDGRFLDDFERDELLMKLSAGQTKIAAKLGILDGIDPDVVAVAEAGAKIQAAHDRLDAIKLDADPDAARKIDEEKLK